MARLYQAIITMGGGGAVGGQGVNKQSGRGRRRDE